ncbi:MAG: hypothetical protein ACXU95_15435 [Isosphaeraceae bacterium]
MVAWAILGRFRRTTLAVMPGGVKLLLFAVVLLLFDIALAMESTGLGAAVFLVAVVGLILGFVGLIRRDPS